MNEKDTIVLYHANCFDGWISAWLMHLFFLYTNTDAEFIAVRYNEPIPDVTGKHVYIVDFSYSLEVLKEASKVTKSITMLDHHLTASQQWGGYNIYVYNCESGCKIHAIILEEKSGAGLVLEYIDTNLDIYNKSINLDAGILKCIKGSAFNNKRLQRIVAATQDRDLWQFKLPDTNIIYEALQMAPKTFEEFNMIVFIESDKQFDERLIAAKYYLEVKEKLAQDFASKHQYVNLLGYLVPICNCPASFASRVGEILANDENFSITYCLSTTKVFCSLRSNSRVGIDVSEIAKVFNGGGHQHSAGFGLTIDNLKDLLSGFLTANTYIPSK